MACGDSRPQTQQPETVLRLARNALRQWSEDRICRLRPIPDPLWQCTIERYPLLSWRTPADVDQVRRLATLFLARKEFSGADGFTVTDEIAVAVSAQAVLPVLHLGLELYERFVGIVLHHEPVVARRELLDEDGVVHEFDEELAGEAMQDGPVMLSWQDVDLASAPGAWAYNLTIHEFAHVIDMADGAADGVPPMPDRATRDAWLNVLHPAYDSFCQTVDQEGDPPIDPYGAESIDEFFAVASESFFADPKRLAQGLPAVYRLLSGYYRQDPKRYLR